jgi:hypothetical protein
MLTYAAGFDSSTVIWISERIREEHRQAIEWLNERTSAETNFFAIEIEVIRIDESRPAYNFKLVVFPNEWHKTRAQSSAGKLTPKEEAYKKFFQALIDDLREKYSFTAARIGQPQNWYTFPSGISGIVYSASFAQGQRIRVELYVDVGESEKNKELFDWLLQHKQSIELEVGQALSWERMEDKQASRIAIYRDGSIESEEVMLNEIKSWTIAQLLAFKKVFSPRLQKYKKEMKSFSALNTVASLPKVQST